MRNKNYVLKIPIEIYTADFKLPYKYQNAIQDYFDCAVFRGHIHETFGDYMSSPSIIHAAKRNGYLYIGKTGENCDELAHIGGHIQSLEYHKHKTVVNICDILTLTIERFDEQIAFKEAKDLI